MPLDFEKSQDGAWRAQGMRRHYRICMVREATGSKYRVFMSLDRDRGSGTQAITGLHETYEQAVERCEAAEREDPPTHGALERKQRG